MSDLLRYCDTCGSLLRVLGTNRCRVCTSRRPPDEGLAPIVTGDEPIETPPAVAHVYSVYAQRDEALAEVERLRKTLAGAQALYKERRQIADTEIERLRAELESCPSQEDVDVLTEELTAEKRVASIFAEQRDAALALLRRVEWQLHGPTMPSDCGVCGGLRPHHAADCELAALLGEEVK